jgi:hypothetical protein
MPLTISLRRAADAFGVKGPAAGRRLKGLPVTKSYSRNRGAPQHIYALASVLPRSRKDDEVSALIRNATDDHSLYVGSGPEVMESARALDRWLSPPMRDRYARVRTLLLAGLSAARGGEAFLPHIETLNQKVLLQSNVLRHVVLGAPNSLDWRAFGPAFAITNATAELEV